MKPTQLLAALAFAAAALPVLAEEVVVYSARNEQLIKPLFDAYTRDTGVQIKFITDKEGPLMARLKAEGRNVCPLLCEVFRAECFTKSRSHGGRRAFKFLLFQLFLFQTHVYKF